MQLSEDNKFNGNSNEDFKEEVMEFLKNYEEEEKKKSYESGDLRADVPSSEITDEQIEFATQKAFEELEQIRRAFTKFQEEIEHLEITKHTKHGIGALAEMFQAITELLKNNVNEGELSEEGKLDYVRAQRVRAEILAQVYNRYKN